MSFDLLGLIYVILIIGLGFYGYIKGFFASLTSLVKSFASLLISTFISRPIAALFMASSVGKNWSLSIAEGLNKRPAFNVAYTGSVDDKFYKLIKIPKNMRSLINSLVSSNQVVTEDVVTYGDLFGRAIAYYALIILAFIGSFLVCMIVVNILLHVFKPFTEHNVIGRIDSVIGCVIYVFLAICAISLFSYLIAFIVPLDNGLSKWFITTMRLDSDTWSISKFFYEYNFLNYIISFFQSIGSF